MVKLSAEVEVVGEHRYLTITSEAEGIRLPLSEDKPKDVMQAFNKLIQRLKDGEFQVVLSDPGDDLFSQVALEYIKQLNQELLDVRAEMSQYGLLDK